MAARAPLKRNDNFFQQQGSADNAEKKVQRAFQRCAESGMLNLSEQKLVGDLPASVCNFHEATWAENWWEQYPITKIDVSHNLLERIPPDIANLSECTNFVALSNRLNSIPEELFTALPLKQLNVRQNLLQELPGRAMTQATELVELVVSENSLTSLPTEVFGIETLEVLEASGNRIRQLPEAGWACSRLRRLDISRNGIGPILPIVLGRCCGGALRELSVAGNALQDLGDLFQVPEGHGWRSSLVLIDLSNNQLGPCLKMASLRSLDTLNISSNRLSVLELGDGPFPALTNVLAGDNRLEEYPRGLLPASAPKICTLDLSNNSLVNLPPELGLNEALKRVSLEGNTLRSIRPDLLRGGAEKLKAYLRSRLASTGVEEEDLGTTLTEELRAAVGSKELRLEGRALSALPALPSGLRALRLPGNELTAASLLAALNTKNAETPVAETLRILEAPKNQLGASSGAATLICSLLQSLPTLQELDLSFNHIAEVGPAGSWNFVQNSLTRADLAGNGLAVFPVELLTACPALNDLRVRQNQISTLDHLVSASRASLSNLDLEENRLASVPAWLPSALPRLRTLLLANNAIGPTLPPELGFWNSLQAVSLQGNPLRSLRQSMIATGWPAVAAHLRDRLPEDAPTAVAVPPPPAARPPVSSDGTTPGTGYVAPPQPASHASTRVARAAVKDLRPDLSDRAARLRSEVGALEEELAAPGISRARQSTVTHSLRMKRAEFMKADKELKRLSECADDAEEGNR